MPVSATIENAQLKPEHLCAHSNSDPANRCMAWSDATAAHNVARLAATAADLAKYWSTVPQEEPDPYYTRGALELEIIEELGRQPTEFEYGALIVMDIQDRGLAGLEFADIRHQRGLVIDVMMCAWEPEEYGHFIEELNEKSANPRRVIGYRDYGSGEIARCETLA